TGLGYAHHILACQNRRDCLLLNGSRVGISRLFDGIQNLPVELEIGKGFPLHGAKIGKKAATIAAKQPVNSRAPFPLRSADPTPEWMRHRQKPRDMLPHVLRWLAAYRRSALRRSCTSHPARSGVDTSFGFLASHRVRYTQSFG